METVVTKHIGIKQKEKPKTGKAFVELHCCVCLTRRMPSKERGGGADLTKMATYQYEAITKQENPKNTRGADVHCPFRRCHDFNKAANEV